MHDDCRARLEQDYPGLVGTTYAKTSECDPDYNCVAWAAGENDRWWEPAPPVLGYYWPPGAPLGGTVAALVETYRTVGFEPCGADDLEVGFENVAIYGGRSGEYTHAARRLPGGHWTSKLGPDADITHEHPDHLAGSEYGTVWCYMKRRLPQAAHEESR